MKLKSIFMPLAAIPVLFLSLNANAGYVDTAYINPLGPNSASINFITLTEASAADGGLGESSWSELLLPEFFGLKITGHATNDLPNVTGTPDTEQFAYLDWGNAGLGVCKDAIGAPSGANSGNSTNSCQPSSDDNVTIKEYLEFSFTENVRVDNLWFNNNHDGGFHAGDMVSIDDAPFAVALGIVDGANGIGSFDLLAGQVLKVGYNNEEFYVSGMAVSAVPVPAAIWLFGSALVGFVGFGRRRNVA